MKLYTFQAGREEHIGAELDGDLVDLNVAHSLRIGKPGAVLAPSLLELFRGGEAALKKARLALRHAAKKPRVPRGRRLRHDPRRVKLRAPIPRPGKILCSGINYRGHLDENPGAKLPETPFFFSKLPSCVIGPGDPIVKPAMSRQVDYEVELAVVFHRTARSTPPAKILDCVAGYTILHDVSARDIQFKDSQITLGKNFDTFAPIGPCIVTRDELDDLSDVKLRTWVNGRLLQDSSTRDWVFPLPVLLSSLAAVMTLEPGDIVSTGCPAGTGFFRKPQVFLEPGDTCVLEIEGIGRLENPVG